MKVIPPDTQRNWSNTWTLQRSLCRTWNVLSSDKDVQKRVVACSVRIRNFEWKMHDKNADGNNPVWVCEGWDAINQEFRTLRKEKQECLSYKPDDRKFGWASVFRRAPHCVPRHRFEAGHESSVRCGWCTAPSALYTRLTQRLSRPPPFQKLCAENRMLQLNI